MPDPVKALSVPPTTVTSTNAKVVEDSLRVKVMVAVWPDFKVEVDEVMATVGATVSVRLTCLVAGVLLLVPSLTTKLIVLVKMFDVGA